MQIVRPHTTIGADTELWVKESDVQALQARVRELEGAITGLLPHLPTEGEALDNASLNEGRMGEYDRLSLQLRRLLKGTP